MAIGDAFDIPKVRACAWSERAATSGLQRRLVARERRRVTNAPRRHCPT
jgi:hypothetical protein